MNKEEKQEISIYEVPVISVHTAYGRLMFKTEDEEKALELYAESMGWSLDKLKILKPTVKAEKVVRPCLKKSESRNYPDSSTKQSTLPSSPKASM
ncbi:hypothetical protein [Gimesia aquarii]|uniref:Uncharacterized protein n=1 Tax=Gimesia aquarii TaxID=2527964 RepID=A0A517VP04_9PLAN|nr:hypothetical protein [Gimesia aquarii]QDT94746.1 hypothetical protein V144x_01770 [Gimesia aquarii]